MCIESILPGAVCGFTVGVQGVVRIIWSQVGEGEYICHEIESHTERNKPAKTVFAEHPLPKSVGRLYSFEDLCSCSVSSWKLLRISFFFYPWMSKSTENGMKTGIEEFREEKNLNLMECGSKLIELKWRALSNYSFFLLFYVWLNFGWWNGGFSHWHDIWFSIENWVVVDQ